MKKITLSIILMMVAMAIVTNARTLQVGASYEFATFSAAANQAVAGDTILFFDSPITQSSYISNLRGTADLPIVITSGTGDYILFSGGGSAFQLSNPAHLNISRLAFEGQTQNGVNIDDGGDFNNPAFNITFDDCKWLGMNASGNNDCLKMSGVVNFTITNCSFENGSAGGSIIDMVGCHDGTIENNIFRNGGSNSIQAKGGTKSIRISRNLFINGGLRALNIGGSTGMEYFRPLDAPAESEQIIVSANIFFGSQAPIAYVGTRNSVVINNTIINPDKWVIRILRENNNAQMLFDQGNEFSNNIVYITNAAASPSINIGPNTISESYTFRNNLWFNHENVNWMSPNVPVSELNSIRGVDPLFSNIADSILIPEQSSVIKGAGYKNNYAKYDYYGNWFNNPPSIGAIEIDVSSIENENNIQNNILISPNPAQNTININYNNNNSRKYFEIISISGQIVIGKKELIADENIDISFLANGAYLILIETDGKIIPKLFIVNR